MHLSGFALVPMNLTYYKYGKPMFTATVPMLGFPVMQLIPAAGFDPTNPGTDWGIANILASSIMKGRSTGPHSKR